jgi:hypothetical protein
MSPKRGDRVAPPPGPNDWDIRFRNNDAARGWEELCRQAPGNTLDAWTTMRRNPMPRTDSPRHSRLHWDLSTVRVGDKLFDHWQIEVTGGGRVWYLVDRDKATIWIDYAGPGHPKATE